MPILQIRDVTFVRDDVRLLQSVNIALESGRRETYVCAEAFHASLLARVAAGIVKPARGNVFIGDYDPAIQPVQAKRLVGFVPASLPAVGPRAFESYIRYRAALWSIEPALAMQRARHALFLLEPAYDRFAAALAGALISAPPLVVIDQPPRSPVAAAAQAIGAAAIFTTHACAEDAKYWAL